MRTHYSLIYSTLNGDDAPQNPIRRQNTTKLHRNDGRTPMSSLRFYADTYIITTYYLNNTSVTCIFSYVIYVA